MKPLNKLFQFEEQVLMAREVQNIKARMQQIVEHTQTNRISQAEAMAHLHQMQQLASRVQLIRARCFHVWKAEYEWVGHDLKAEKVCSICETHQAFAD